MRGFPGQVRARPRSGLDQGHEPRPLRPRLSDVITAPIHRAESLCRVPPERCARARQWLAVQPRGATRHICCHLLQAGKGPSALRLQAFEFGPEGAQGCCFGGGAARLHRLRFALVPNPGCAKAPIVPSGRFSDEFTSDCSAEDVRGRVRSVGIARILAIHPEAPRAPLPSREKLDRVCWVRDNSTMSQEQKPNWGNAPVGWS